MISNKKTKKVYEDCYGKPSSNFYKILPDKDIKKLIKNIKKDQKEFDIKDKVILIAGGTGRSALSFLKKKPKKIFYIDLVKKNILKIKKLSKNKIKTTVGDLANIQSIFKKQKFDLIYMEGVYQHLENPKEITHEMLKMLNNNGYFYLDFYRSGIIYWLLVELIRKKLLFKDYTKFKDYLKLNNLLHKKISYSSSNLLERTLDDLFVPKIRFYNLKKTKKIIQNSGFKIIYFDKLNNLSKSFSSYKYFYTCLKKLKSKKIQKMNIKDQKNTEIFGKINEYKKFIDNFNKLKFKSKSSLFKFIINIFLEYSNWQSNKNEKNTILILNKYFQFYDKSY
jgi:ubiquinone/menaquinone biosynthesis C-methylase UbiE